MRRPIALTLAATAVLAAPAVASAAPRTASATGVAKVAGTEVLVEVVVRVPRGQTARQATNAVLAEQGARAKPPPTGGGSGGPGFTGLFWDVLPVVQSYNPLGQAIAAQGALQSTQSTWSSVRNSTFRMSFGGTTNRCPSIVRECPGPQVLDGNNDVGWQRLSPNILGVTWSTTGGADEADMALNTRTLWSSGCVDVAGRIDVESVLLHENGHVAGLDHATSTASIMYPSYQGARCDLGALDEQAIAALY